MAAFICLAAARGEVLRRAGHDFDADGLQGAPGVAVLVSEDAPEVAIGPLGKPYRARPESGGAQPVPDDGRAVQGVERAYHHCRTPALLF